MNKKKETQEFIKRREKIFTRFMLALSKSEELKYDLFLLEWLQNNDSKMFKNSMKKYEKLKYIRKMDNVISYQGRVSAQMISNSAVFCSKMTDFIDSY